MVKSYSFLLAFGLVEALAEPLLAHQGLTCMSCAPGDGCCRESCHGYPGGRFCVAWFPIRYQ